MAVDKDVVIGPALKSRECEALSKELLNEILECIRMHRAKQGLDTNFDEDHDLIKHLIARLDLMEEKSQVDPDQCGDYYDNDELRTELAMTKPSPDKDFGVDLPEKQTAEKAAWKKIASAQTKLTKDFENIPVMKGMTLTAHPLHFCKTDEDDVRKILFE